MKLGFVITGRMKSTRLPRKLTLEIMGKEMISWMIDRAKLRFKPEEIIIATSTHPQDDELKHIAEREGVGVFRGDEEDVIRRLYEAAVANAFDYFINITADCPMFGFDYVDEIERILVDKKADLVTSLDLPHGIFTYGMRTQSIEKVLAIKKTTSTEVWGEYFYNNPDLFVVEKLNVPKEKRREDYRLTLDYPEDFEFFKAVYNQLGNEAHKVSSDQLIQFLDTHPEIVNLNKDCKQLYQKRWESQKVTKIEEREA